MTRQEIEQKAKEIANKYVSLGFKCSFSNELYEAAMDMACWMLSHQWVSVENELPPKGEIVIAHYETADEIGETFATHDGTNWGDGGEYFEDDSVTHWMSIPPLAEEGGGK